MRTRNILQVKENRKDIPIMPPDLALRLTLISSNYLSLEHIFTVPAKGAIEVLLRKLTYGNMHFV